MLLACRLHAQLQTCCCVAANGRNGPTADIDYCSLRRTETRRLLGTYVGRLDYRPPLLDLCFMKGAKCLGRLLIARWDVLTEVKQTLTERRVIQCLDDRGIELGDDLLGRPLGCPKATPNRNIEARQPCLVYGWNIGRRG